jgi:hypothetical protein
MKLLFANLLLFSYEFQLCVVSAFFWKVRLVYIHKVSNVLHVEPGFF